MRKIVYIVLDGIGDEPVAELGHKTPLEDACTPYLDRLAHEGRTGLVHTFGEGIAPESDIAVISLLGFDPQQYYTGRGPLEAFSEQMNIADGMLALRANFATVLSDGKTIQDRRVLRSLSTDEATALAKEINTKVTLSGATFEFKNSVGHRAVLVIRGVRSRLSGRITNTDPAYERRGMFGVARQDFASVVSLSAPMEGFELDRFAQEAALLLNEFTEKSQRVLNDSALNKKRVQEGKLPANAILCRSAGDRLPQFVPIQERFGCRFGCFVEMPVERGIALLTGMQIVDIPESSGHWDVDYPVWAKVALDALAKYDGLYIHIKGPDEFGHDGDYRRKKEIIEAIDAFFFSHVLAVRRQRDIVVCVTSDLSTVCRAKAHSSLAVPLVICGGTIKPDGSLGFSEKACQAGSLGRMKGTDLLPLLIRTAQG